MNKSLRLTGIDLCRGFALYGVILLHSDEGLSETPTGWNNIIHFVEFAVPFFLATSFYLSVNKLWSGGSYKLSARLKRLVIPYVAWTLIYVTYKFLKFIIDRDPNHIEEVLKDPTGTIFLGTAGFHLYFLPLVVVGSILIKLLDDRIKSHFFDLKKASFLFLVSIVLYQLTIASGNAYSLESQAAFQEILNYQNFGILAQPIRVLLVFLFWSFRCLVYITIALVVAQLNPHLAPYFRNRENWWAIAFIGAFFILGLSGESVPESIREVFLGYSALGAGICLSPFLKDDRHILKHLGICSFGIYLIHLLILDVFQITIYRLPGFNVASLQQSIVYFLLLSLSVLLLSWAIADRLMQHRWVSKILFGTR
jgi:fucose 4-O-acetylase-like acetyltransferase